MSVKQPKSFLSYFLTKRSKELLVVCPITGMSFTILTPEFNNIKGMQYSGLSPLADLEAAEQLGNSSYAADHKHLDSQTLAGGLLSLLYHYDLRSDKLSAIEANALICALDHYKISTALRFVAQLSDYEQKRIPHLSLEEQDARSLLSWVYSANKSLEQPRTVEEPVYRQPKTKAAYFDQSIVVELRKEARELLKECKPLLPIKLLTIVQISIQKNNLATITSELRANIIKGLEKTGSNEAIKLAQIFAKAASTKTNQEKIVTDLLGESGSALASTQTRPKTLAEILAAKLGSASMLPMPSASESDESAEGEAPVPAAQIASQIASPNVEANEDDPLLATQDPLLMDEAPTEELSLEDEIRALASELDEEALALEEEEEDFVEADEAWGQDSAESLESLQGETGRNDLAFDEDSICEAEDEADDGYQDVASLLDTMEANEGEQE